LIILLSSSSLAQIGAIVSGGIGGLWLCRAAATTRSNQGHMSVPVSRPAGLLALAAFFLLLTGLPILSTLTHSQGVALFEAFYRSGALVFGGGHVVLPYCARRQLRRDG
jgi:chromate transporter